MQTSNPSLFTSISFRELKLNNRIIVSPMCQYSSTNGCVSDWHLMHLGQFAVSGAGLILVEMTNVQPEGRISPHCVGLFDDKTEAALKRVVEFCRTYGNVPIGIQLAHAGRKASTRPPWQDRQYITPEEGGWVPVAPSAISTGRGGAVPMALDREEIHQLVDAFAQSAIRADRAGFAAIELHAAHGYLLHQFLSPLSNLRDDEFGGPLDNRMRFPLAVFSAVREVWPAEKPVGVRVSATDWAVDGWQLDDTVQFATALKALGCDWIDVSSGGLVQHQDITSEPGYQVHLARAVRNEVQIPTIAVGLITDPHHAESIIAKGDADAVALARGMLYNPRWPWHAAEALGAKVQYPNQYLRCQPIDQSV